MTNEELKDFIIKQVPEAVFADNKQMVTVSVAPEQLFSLIKTLKTAKETSFDFLVALTGIDTNPGLGVVYILESTTLKHIVSIKTITDNRTNPAIDSLVELYAGAELNEREVFDLFGITFNNHPDMRRLFLDDEWKGYPLRKDYVDTVNIVDLIK